MGTPAASVFSKKFLVDDSSSQKSSRVSLQSTPWLPHLCKTPAAGHDIVLGAKLFCVGGECRHAPTLRLESQCTVEMKAHVARRFSFLRGLLLLLFDSRREPVSVPASCSSKSSESDCAGNQLSWVCSPNFCLNCHMSDTQTALSIDTGSPQASRRPFSVRSRAAIIAHNSLHATEHDEYLYQGALLGRGISRSVRAESVHPLRIRHHQEPRYCSSRRSTSRHHGNESSCHTFPRRTIKRQRASARESHTCHACLDSNGEDSLRQPPWMANESVQLCSKKNTKTQRLRLTDTQVTPHNFCACSLPRVVPFFGDLEHQSSDCFCLSRLNHRGLRRLRTAGLHIDDA